MDNSVIEEFSRQAKELGAAFAACKGKSTTNIIFDEKHKDLVETIRKDITKQHSIASKAEKEAHKSIANTPEVSLSPDVDLESSAPEVSLFQDVDLESSRIWKSVTEACEKLTERIQPMLKSVAYGENGEVQLGYDQTNSDSLTGAINEFKKTVENDISKLGKPQQTPQVEKVELPKEKSSEIGMMLTDITKAARAYVENQSSGLPQPAKDRLIMNKVNHGLKEAGINATVSISNGKIAELTFEPKDKIAITAMARQHNKQVAMGEHSRAIGTQTNLQDMNPLVQGGTPKLEVVKPIAAKPAAPSL